MKSRLKSLRIPALVGLGLLAATSAQSVNRGTHTPPKVTMATSLVGASSLIVWSPDYQQSTPYLQRWSEAMQAEYARDGLRVQTLMRSGADVRVVASSQPLINATQQGVMLFDNDGQLRLVIAMPSDDQLSTAEAAAQALLAGHALPTWIQRANRTQRF